MTNESIGIDYLNPMGTDNLQSDDEFMMEWYRKNQGSTQLNSDHSDDGENALETILV
jgi:hypothetical protein